LYVVLDSPARARAHAAGAWNIERVWVGAAVMAMLGLLVTLLLGGFAFRRLTLPLHRLAERIGRYRGPGGGPIGADSERAADAPSAPVLAQPSSAGNGDEVQAIGAAFDAMTVRLEAQAEREAEQARTHRETLAGVAHDLRTPLTALHGHLEALAAEPARQTPDRRERVLAAALSQSDKVRRLSQQLFELATLQSSDHQVLQRERFSLDELVTDAVRKFELLSPAPPVMLAGDPPGRIELDGDLHLIERALTNLIDNALRHAGGPVKVSLRREGGQAQVWVEDAGPGLPTEVVQRLQRGQSLRDPPLRRVGAVSIDGGGRDAGAAMGSASRAAVNTLPTASGIKPPAGSAAASVASGAGSAGGIGGLGLAIAQRVAALHGGSLMPLSSPQGGTRLCLELPLAR
ncbi:MAG: sensor histidine kinase, partial [Rubrivivax sp.]